MDTGQVLEQYEGAETFSTTLCVRLTFFVRLGVYNLAHYTLLYISFLSPTLKMRMVFSFLSIA